jgi:chromosome segregation ATPase
MQSKNVLITVIVILALLNGYFSCHNRSLNKKNIALEAEKNKLDSLYTSVSSELKIAELTLDSLRGKNAEMDSIITIREKELAETKLEIESLLKKNKLSLAELAGIKKLVKTLQEENDKYFKDINQMNQKINALTASNDSLKNYLESEISNNEKLTAEKKILGKKAELGALLKPENITGTGIKIDSKNSESETNSAKKSQKIKVCFDVLLIG